MTNENELQVQDAEKQEIDETQAERTRDRKAFVPRADIYEDGDNIFIVADVPGVDENSVEITLEKSVLTINGYVEPRAPQGYALAYAEYEIGDYQRSFKLSNQIDLDKIEATAKDGVLRLLLPKVGPVQTKKIAVKAPS
jgi:HSP20 family molecular chaperone IbpA